MVAPSHKTLDIIHNNSFIRIYSNFMAMVLFLKWIYIISSSKFKWKAEFPHQRIQIAFLVFHPQVKCILFTFLSVIFVEPRECNLNFFDCFNLIVYQFIFVLLLCLSISSLALVILVPVIRAKGGEVKKYWKVNFLVHVVLVIMHQFSPKED